MPPLVLILALSVLAEHVSVVKEAFSVGHSSPYSALLARRLRLMSLESLNVGSVHEVQRLVVIKLRKVHDVLCRFNRLDAIS